MLKNHQNVNDVQCVVEEEVTGSKIVYNHYGCDKCCERNESNQYNFNETSIQHDNQPLVKDLIKPCGVRLGKLDLTLPEMSHREKKIPSQKVDKIQNDKSIFEHKPCSVYLRSIDLTLPEISHSALYITSQNVHKIENSNSINEFKPCVVHLRKLDLTLPEMSHSEKKIPSQKVDKIENDNSVIENGIEDSLENIRSSIRKRLGSILVSLNETAALVKAAVS